MDPGWCGLGWTPWAMLEREAIRRGAPGQPGLYRIRREGSDLTRLTYIGQTGRGLRERLLGLASGAHAEICPFNDPHSAAPHMWLLRFLEVSCAPVPGDVQILRGTEDMLLWRHRIETGDFTEANYGRFYPGYVRPTNRWIVRKGTGAESRTRARRAEPLPAGTLVKNFGLATPPLHGDGAVLHAPWWQRACLANASILPNGPGVCCIYERNANEPIYIGETSAFLARSATHAVTAWSLHEPWIAVLQLAAGTPKYAIHELESDLLGWHFRRTGRAPVFQYRISRTTRDNAA
jgi:hypothetical protein